MLQSLINNFGAACAGGDFLGFPKWYKYLDGVTDPTTGICSPALGNLSDIWLILAAVIEVMLRIAAIMAVAFVIFGAIGYMTSQGEPDKTAKARAAIINALIGLGISVIAATAVAFIAGRFN